MSLDNGLFPFVNVKINPRNFINYKIRDNIVNKIIFMLGAKVILSYFFIFYFLYFIFFMVFYMVNIRKI